MQRVAKFHRVSREQYLKDAGDAQGEASYDDIVLPVRATAGSAGYDINTPFSFSLAPGENIRIATGIRCRIKKGWTMLVVPKSGLGVRFRVQLDNSVGVVDSDYFEAENEGHIFVQITNDSRSGKVLEMEAGRAFVQALFLPFGITEDDEADGSRSGGFGSTGA